MKIIDTIAVCLAVMTNPTAFAGQSEILCSIRSSGTNLSCQILGKDRRVMTAEDIAHFIDSADENTYITVKSQKGINRIFLVDGKASQFDHLKETKRSAPISEISAAKLALFSEIEKKVIKISSDLDARTEQRDLVLFDPTVTYEKLRKENKELAYETDQYLNNSEKVCEAVPSFTNLSKTNQKLEKTLSSIIFAFQDPESCMAKFPIYKDRDGSVDLRQLDGVSDHFKSNCLKHQDRATASSAGL